MNYISLFNLSFFSHQFMLIVCLFITIFVFLVIFVYNFYNLNFYIHFYLEFFWTIFPILIVLFIFLPLLMLFNIGAINYNYFVFNTYAYYFIKLFFLYYLLFKHLPECFNSFFAEYNELLYNYHDGFISLNEVFILLAIRASIIAAGVAVKLAFLSCCGCAEITASISDSPLLSSRGSDYYYLALGQTCHHCGLIRKGYHYCPA
jgi:hypothetical protein